jgi:hypothetical protein
MVGQTVGTMIGYNLFIPLNDVDWINTYLVSDPVKKPFLTNQIMCYFSAILLLGQALFSLFFVQERSIRGTNEGMTLGDVYLLFPKHFKNPHMRKLIFYIFGSSFLMYSVKRAFDLDLVNNGYMNMSRSTVSNIDTIISPLLLLASLSTVYFMKSGQLVRMFHLTQAFMTFLCVFQYYTYMDLINNRELGRATAARVFARSTQF